MKGMKGVGKWAFLIGIVGALILGALAGLGVFATPMWMTVVLVLAGIVIGLLNVTDAESVPLMVAALVIGVGAGVLGMLPLVGEFIKAVMTAVAAVVLPAGIIIALSTVWKKAS